MENALNLFRFSIRAGVTCLIVWLLFVPGASAQTTVVLQDGLNGYSGTKDNSIFADRPNNSNGTHNFIFSGVTVSSLRRALVRFDLSPIPENAVVTAVELRLLMERSGRETGEADLYTLHRVLQAWGEGSSDSGEPGGNGAAAAPGEATWRAAAFGESTWITEGGDFIAEPSFTSVVDAENNTFAVFTSATMVADVQTWLNDPASNHGWILNGDDNPNRSARRFASREYAIQEQRPALHITYTEQTRVTDWSLF